MSAAKAAISSSGSAGELAGDASLLIDIAVIALDPGFGTVDEFLRQKLEAERAQLRPEPTQHLEIFGAKRFALVWPKRKG